GLGFWLLIGTGIWVAALFAMALHLAWQSYRLDAGDPAMALRLFKSNRDAGLILTAGLVINQIAA
ncbi:MAG: 4-hydroxybenzoate octaprenyltransferase, partial [Pseudomonadota bacterium]|nr:4-hydroxybenzoate octaprenyltransferase [Pseudomonadota bacterium]